jgi:hypothetical protein
MLDYEVKLIEVYIVGLMCNFMIRDGWIVSESSLLFLSVSLASMLLYNLLVIFICYYIVKS